MSINSSEKERIFQTAADIACPDERAAYLAAQCDQDAPLRAEVEELLRHDAAAQSFLNRPAAALMPAGGPDEDAICEAPGDVVGPYQLTEQIGEGAFGRVFVAQQEQPVRRKVAIKFIRPGMDTREVIGRFDAERQALALMDHPHIAKVMDAGATETGRPYFVMELVQGVPITEYCDDRRLNTRKRLQLFLKVCRAVHHAHQKGIIHRDLKPSNVLVAEIDGAAVPKVIDFGVAKAISAKLTEQSVYTQFSQIVGTPLYMSPEQAGRGVIDIDTRSDVYSLGVLLYELLTGSTPFDRETLKRADYEELRRIIREDQPRRPSVMVGTLPAEALSTVAGRRENDPRTLSSSLQGELDWLVMKALEKERGRRYESAAALAEDVQRFLSNQTITARPPSAAYRFKKFAQRNSARLIPAMVAAAVLLVGLTFALVAVVKERGEKEALLYETARRLYVSQMRQAFAALQAYDYGAVGEYLARSTPSDGSPDFRGWEWYLLQWLSQRLFAEAPDGHVIQAAWRPHHHCVAVCVSRPDGVAVELWKPESRSPLRILNVFQDVNPSVMRWSRDGARLAIANSGGRGIVLDGETGGVVFDHDLYQGVENFDWMSTIDLSPKGQTLASASFYGHLRLWDVNDESKSPREIELLPDEDAANPSDGGQNVGSVAFSPDGDRLAVRSRFGRVLIWDLREDSFSADDDDFVRTSSSSGNAIEWDPNGDRFVATDASYIALYDPNKPDYVAKLSHVQASTVCWIAGNSVATGGADHTIRLWELEKQSQIQSLQIDRRPVDVCGSSPDGKYLAAKTGNELKFVRLDRIDRPLGYEVFSPPTSQDDRGWNLIRWSHDGRYIASGQNDADRYVGDYGATVRIFNAQRGICLVEYLTSPNVKLDWPADNRSVQVVDSMGRFHSLSVAEPHVRHVHLLPEESDYFKRKTFETFSGSAVNRQRGLIALPRCKANDDRGYHTYIYDFEALEIIDALNIDGGELRWSPDGRLLCNVRGTQVLIYDAEHRIQHGREVVPAQQRRLRSPTWNSTSTELAVGTFTGAICVIDVETLETRLSLVGHRAPVDGIAWSPDSTRIASVADDGTLRIWDNESGDEVAVLRLPAQAQVSSVDWSPDGRKLAAGLFGTGEVLVFDAGPSLPITAEASLVSDAGIRKGPTAGTLATALRGEAVSIDDFDDRNDDGWTRRGWTVNEPLGPGSHDPTSGAYQLKSHDVPPGSPGISYLASLWEASSDPMYSNGLVKGKVHIDSEGCEASIAFRISGDDTTGHDGYLFAVGEKIVGDPRTFYFFRIRAGQATHSTRMSIADLKFEIGTEYWIEAGGIGDQLSMKVWRVGDPEPDAPQLIVTDSTYSTGLIGVAANVHSAFPRPTPINATFDDMSFTPLSHY